MIVPKLHKNENERLKAVQSYDLLDTLPESDFDDITKLISTICEVPISLITLLDADRNFIKSHFGIELNESPRDISFCGHAILSDKDIFIIEDARESELFKNNPLLEDLKAIFYAGVPLKNPEGYPLGTLCVYDHKPRKLTLNQIETLKIVARQVMNLFELRRKNKLLESATEQLTVQNKFLEKFSGQVSHDLKSPIANISSLTEFVKNENSDVLSQETLEYLDSISESTESLRKYIDGALLHYKASTNLDTNLEDTTLKIIYDEISAIQNLKKKNFNLLNDANLIRINKSALMQILFNLVENAYKYNNNATPRVDLGFKESETHYHFIVKDNGMGISKVDKDKIFDLFKVANPKDIFGKTGTGIGLFTVKTIIQKLGGDIDVESEVNVGTTFNFSIKK
ncbi:ATP-binding protein [Winogradskyella litorisediminis]|uniref:histidine kinase n=1 Tax=Winogradskyella litorisediminis TaxID=1156618 RepID=A0ABW3N5S1_9FLAO